MEIIFEGGKVVTALSGRHRIKTDQPVENGGEDSAPCPVDLYLASIATCSGIYVKSFCDRRNISTDGIRINQSVTFDEVSDLPTLIRLEISLPADFPDKYRDHVVSAANLCKIKKSILHPPAFEIVTK